MPVSGKPGGETESYRDDRKERTAAGAGHHRRCNATAAGLAQRGLDRRCVSRAAGGEPLVERDLGRVPRPRDARDRSVVLFRGDSAFAWSGRPRVPLDSVDQSVSIAGTPFYLALSVAARGADTGQRAVATQLLYATAPADRIATSLGGRVARR